MLKVGILTLSRSFNAGAYLQAYSLSKFLEENGCQVEFENIYNKASWYKLLKSLLWLETKTVSELFFNIRKGLIFLSAQKKLNYSSTLFGSDRSDKDAIVIGSDEVWNVKNGSFKALPEFFGNSILCDNIIAYAPGAAATTADDLPNYPYIKIGLDKFSSLSARDRNGRDLVNAALGFEPPIVVDPTFLVEFESEPYREELPPFILVYSYNLNERYRAEVLKFAKERSLEVISVGFYANWCHRALNVRPLEFVNLVQRAEYVITDTFHGTMFSCIFKKNFATYASGKAKILDFMEFYGLKARIAGETELEEVLHRKLSDDDLSKLSAQIDSSKQYLIEAVSPESTAVC